MLSVEGLSLEGRREIRSPQKTKVDLQSLEGPRTLSLADGNWELQEGFRMGQTPSLSFWWKGDVGVGSHDPSAADRELADQLRALGYVE